MPDTDRRFGFIAVLGATNAGKSTLVNQLVGNKVSIVSPKVQTTRARIRGIFMEGAAQLVLVDTPGIFNPSRRLDRAMVASAWAEAADSDRLLLVVDAHRGIDKNTQTLLDGMAKTKRRAVLVLNKIDLIPKEKLLPLIAALNQTGLFTDTFCVSAETGENVAELRQFLAAQAPRGEWMFPSDQLSDLPGRLFAAEITREKLFLLLREELPYMLSVETTGWEEKENGIRIEQTIYVARAGQKPIVLGKGGAQIKKIGESSRRELARLLERPVHLFLFVKVKENWADEKAHYAQWGLDFNA